LEERGVLKKVKKFLWVYSSQQVQLCQSLFSDQEPSVKKKRNILFSRENEIFSSSGKTEYFCRFLPIFRERFGNKFVINFASSSSKKFLAQMLKLA
jgi:hypothetical protein